MKITLPKPPTTNHIYAYTSRKGFASSYITKEGKQFFTDAQIAIAKQLGVKIPMITVPCEVWVNVYTSTRRDVDGSIKPVLDVLQKASVIENDYLFYALHATREKCAKGEDRVEVEILGY